MHNRSATSNYSIPLSAGSDGASDSIENCVRLIGTATDHRRQHLSGRKPAPLGIAVCAIILYICIELAGSRFYHKAARSVDGLPDNVDVLILGSSVIATPLINYEFPQMGSNEVLDRSPVLELPKVERLLSSIGAPKKLVYNASAHGESIEITDDFLKRLLKQGKRPRLMMLFVFPQTVLTWHLSHKHRIVPANLKLSQNLEGLHHETRKKLSVMTCSAYSKLHFPNESRANNWERVQDSFRKAYRQELSEQKLQVLANILESCRSHSIKTLVVSTPLAASNRSIMPPGFYDRYSRTLREIVQKNQSAESLEDGGFIDFGQSPEFIESSDFFDPVHCNAKACEKMLQVLAPKMVRILNH